MSRGTGRGFVCPHCKGDTHVVDSIPGRGAVRRRRECLKCDKKYSTLEIGPEDMRLLTLARAFLRRAESPK